MSFRISNRIALVSIVFTLCVWTWIIIQPAGTFHDQGGLRITFVYFPVTFLVWLACWITGIVLRQLTSSVKSEALIPSSPARQGLFHVLVALGLLLSVGTLLIA